MVVIDTFFYNAKEAMKLHIKSWSKGGKNYKYSVVKYGVLNIKIIDQFEEIEDDKNKRFFDSGIVGVVLKIS